MRRCTIKDIAEAAGISHTAVSLALRNHPKVSAETREKVRKLAEQMGYRPDPLLGALVAYRQGLRPAGFRETIAWVTNYSTQDGWRINAYNKYFEGATERAQQLGYSIDEVWLREPGVSARQVSRVFRARGIRGALICPLPDRMHRLNLPWEQLTAVTFGHGIVAPKLNRVSCDHMAAMVLAIRMLRRHGYRRIGLAIPLAHDVRVRHSYSAAYCSEQQRQRISGEIPIFFSRESPEKTALRRWVKQYKPDAVLTVGYGWVPEWFEQNRSSLPEDFTVVLVCSHERRPHYSGIDEDSRVTGASAMDLLFGQLLRNESGVPAQSQILLTQPRWVDGTEFAPSRGHSRLVR